MFGGKVPGPGTLHGQRASCFLHGPGRWRLDDRDDERSARHHDKPPVDESPKMFRAGQHQCPPRKPPGPTPFFSQHRHSHPPSPCEALTTTRVTAKRVFVPGIHRPKAFSPPPHVQPADQTPVAPNRRPPAISQVAQAQDDDSPSTQLMTRSGSNEATCPKDIKGPLQAFPKVR